MSKDALSAIRTQVMWNRLIAVVEEQAQSLLRTAFGTITREAGDLSAGVYNAEGHMIAQAMTGTPGHVNTMATAVGHFFKHYPQSTMKPGATFKGPAIIAEDETSTIVGANFQAKINSLGYIILEQSK